MNTVCFCVCLCGEASVATSHNPQGNMTLSQTALIRIKIRNTLLITWENWVRNSCSCSEFEI